MKEFIDKLIGRLEEEVIALEDNYGDEVECIEASVVFETINELAEEYKDNLSENLTGWIPCSERLPEDGVKVLCYGSNTLGRMRYEVSCYSHKLRWWKCSVITYVFAWMPLPAPYTENKVSDWQQNIVGRFNRVE